MASLGHREDSARKAICSRETLDLGLPNRIMMVAGDTSPPRASKTAGISGLVQWNHGGGCVLVDETQDSGDVWRHGGVDNMPAKVIVLISTKNWLVEDDDNHY